MKKSIYLSAMLVLFVSFVQAQSFRYNFYKGYFQGLGYDIGQEWHGDLKQGQYYTKTFNFNRYLEYHIVALSEDDDVEDIDMHVYTSYNSVYMKDDDESALAEVAFTPSFDRSLTIKVKNYSSSTPNYASRVYFFIAYKNAY